MTHPGQLREQYADSAGLADLTCCTAPPLWERGQSAYKAALLCAGWLYFRILDPDGLGEMVEKDEALGTSS